MGFIMKIELWVTKILATVEILNDMAFNYKVFPLVRHLLDLRSDHIVGHNN